MITLALTALLLAVGSLRSAIADEAHATDTLTAILRLQTATGELESGLRGYLLTSNRRFERPWQAALLGLAPAERRLDALAAGDPQSGPRVAALQASIAAYVADYARPLIAIAQLSPEVARATAAAISALVISGILIVGLGAVGARALSRRLRTATVAASEIAAGRFSARLPEEGAAELAELGRAFNTMAAALDESRRTLLEQNERLKENERRKTELITIVSHELRTPLAGLLGFTSLLLERDFDPTTTRRYLTIVQDESRRLSALLDRFLDVGRVEDDAFELQLVPVDLPQLLREQSELSAADSAGHTLVRGFPEGPLRVMADRAAATGCASRWPTTASASPSRISRRSSRSSTAATPPPAGSRAPGSAWRSRARSSRPTAARSASRAGPAGERRSGSSWHARRPRRRSPEPGGRLARNCHTHVTDPRVALR